MENPDILNNQRRAVIKAAIWGALLCVAYSVLAAKIRRYPREVFLALNLMFGLMHLVFNRATGFVTMQYGNFNSLPLAAFINGVLGAFIFAVAALCWHLKLKSIFEVKSLLVEKLRAVMKASLWGAGLFVGTAVTITIIGRFAPNAFGSFGLDFLVAYIPITLIFDLFGLNSEQQGAFLGNHALALICFLTVYCLMGALIFAIPTAFWQFLMKNDHEK